MIHRLLVWISGALCIGMLSGCAGLMPSNKKESTGSTNWVTYGQAQTFFKSIEPDKTRIEDLSKLPNGVDPRSTGNVVRMMYVTLLPRFLPNSSVSMENLPKGVQECFREKESCVGYELSSGNSDEEGTGNLLLYMTGFKKESIVKSWWVKVFILFRGDIVSYVGIEGTPNGETHSKSEKNPLGPLGNMRNLVGVGGKL